jgi:putative membrane protein insertion efficiency factor
MSSTPAPVAAATRSATEPSAPARVLMLPIRAWRLISVHLPPRCRFHPSCSQYALEALTVHGAARGSWLATKRVGRCHPWHEGGLDPVPPANPGANVRSTLAAPVGAAEEG